MVNCSLLFATQIISIIASAFGIAIAIVIMVQNGGSWTTYIIPIYVLFFCIMLFVVEIYILPCFRFFGFLLKNWGKGATYLLLGFLIFNPNVTLNIVAGVIFWILAVLYIILSFVAKGIARPLAQKTVSLSTSNADYWIEA